MPDAKAMSEDYLDESENRITEPTVTRVKKLCCEVRRLRDLDYDTHGLLTTLVEAKNSDNVTQAWWLKYRELEALRDRTA